jgi:hypothetical protein
VAVSETRPPRTSAEKIDHLDQVTAQIEGLETGDR